MKKILLAGILLLGMSLSLSAGNFEDAKKACDKGDGDGCGKLGFLYSSGQGVEQDDFKAVEFFGKACDAGDAGGCYNLGYSYESGTGVGQDDSKAKELYGKACDGGLTGGCENYAILNKK